ncbi:MAG: AraC family transcriptional regulator N-terminal domain-containing protein, partial [bacterium]|nr:AraC family transcriptional regulator N-terminal domain-containing protein [bacterium]
MDELVDLIAGRAVAEGSNGSSWPGLTYDRFDGPARAHDEVAASLSIRVVAQGRERVRFDDRTCVCGPSEFFVVAQGTRFVTDALEASRDRPLLAASLRIDPVLTIELLSQIEQCLERLPPPPPPRPGGPPAKTQPNKTPRRHPPTRAGGAEEK